MTDTDKLIERMKAALEWYADKVSDCNRHGPEGNAARDALANDIGNRARAALRER